MLAKTIGNSTDNVHIMLLPAKTYNDVDSMIIILLVAVCLHEQTAVSHLQGCLQAAPGTAGYWEYHEPVTPHGGWPWHYQHSRGSGACKTWGIWHVIVMSSSVDFCQLFTLCDFQGFEHKKENKWDVFNCYLVWCFWNMLHAMLLFANILEWISKCCMFALFGHSDLWSS